MKDDLDPVVDTGGSAPDPLDARLARLRAATDRLAPPPDLADRVLARVTSRAVTPAWWAQLVPVGARAVPLAALAAAAALTLAWVGERQLDAGAASAMDLAAVVP